MRYTIDTEEKTILVTDGHQDYSKDRGNYLTLKKMFEKEGYSVIAQDIIEIDNRGVIGTGSVWKKSPTINTIGFVGDGTTVTYTNTDSTNTIHVDMDEVVGATSTKYILT